jgi:fatty acid synthase subunit alpha
VGHVKAVLMKSFGFGQAGGEVLLVHPDYLLAAVGDDEFAEYRTRRALRERGAQRALHEAIAGKAFAVRCKPLRCVTSVLAFTLPEVGVVVSADAL